jgi:hypothetical protein
MSIAGGSVCMYSDFAKICEMFCVQLLQCLFVFYQLYVLTKTIFCEYSYEGKIIRIDRKYELSQPECAMQLF